MTELKNTDLKEALAAPTLIHFAGRDLPVKPINFNSLVRIEDKFGSLDAIDFEKARNQRFLIWAILSGSGIEITEEGVGEMLTFADPEATAGFISSVFRLSGLLAAPDPDASQETKTLSDISKDVSQTSQSKVEQEAERFGSQGKAGVGKSEVGKSEVGKSEVGKSEVGKSEVGKPSAAKE